MQAPGKRVAAAVVGLVVAVTVIATPYARTAAFLLDMAGVSGGARSWIPVAPAPFVTSDILVETRHGSIPVRVYSPDTARVPTVVVFPGVHGGGVDAPRLTQFCGRLSASGVQVVCAPLPDLRQFLITDRSTDMMEDVTVWASEHLATTPARHVTLVGVSFAGGLAIVAAGRESLQHRLTAVVSIGGHGNLARTLRFLTEGTLPDGSRLQPHDYPLAVIALTLTPRLVPDAQVALTRDRIRSFLDASLDDGTGFAHGMPTIRALQDEVATLPEPARTVLRAVVERDVAELGRRLAPHVAPLGDDPALSPALAPLPSVPVFLLHGSDDNVIPASEMPLLAEDFRNRSTAHVTALQTPLLTHAHLVADASLGDLWDLLRFWHAVRQAVFRGDDVS